MKERILTGWSFGRVLYLLLGIYVIIATAMDGHWFGILIGAYFAAMGLFRFGCAAGNCYTGNSYTNSKQQESNEIHYEEVK
jgi:hypothetical protein